jgi:threonine/homoserine/homoserine lactone efflux protein
MLPDITGLTLFFAAAAVLLITPGPAIFYIVARSIDQGRWAGLVSTVGIGVGTLFHVAAAAFGLSALLLSSALAFSVVKFLGAAYLIYLGIRKFLERDGMEPRRDGARRPLARLFYEGMIVNILNPKTALFFFAFLPQFVDVSRGAVAGQVLFLGALFVLMGIASDTVWALLAGSAGDWLRNHRRFLRSQRYFAGTVFIALGITTALSGSNDR